MPWTNSVQVISWNWASPENPGCPQPDGLGTSVAHPRVRAPLGAAGLRPPEVFCGAPGLPFHFFRSLSWLSSCSGLETIAIRGLTHRCSRSQPRTRRRSLLLFRGRLARLSVKPLGDTVNRQRLLRLLILTDVFSMVAGVIAAAIFERTLPEPLRTYVATAELHPFLLVVGLLLLVLLIVAWVGLWRSASWAPAVYVVMWVSCVVVVPFSGPFVGTGIEELFDFVGTAAGGGILVLLVLGIDERRNSGQVTLPGTDTTSEPLPNGPR
jgi:hypothetical protein